MQFEMSSTPIDLYQPGSTVRILRTQATTGSPHLVATLWKLCVCYGPWRPLTAVPPTGPVFHGLVPAGFGGEVTGLGPEGRVSVTGGGHASYCVPPVCCCPRVAGPSRHSFGFPALFCAGYGLSAVGRGAPGPHRLRRALSRVLAPAPPPCHRGPLPRGAPASPLPSHSQHGAGACNACTRPGAPPPRVCLICSRFS